MKLLKYLIFLLSVISQLNASNMANISINGALDDDFFILKASAYKWDLEVGLQMHNPNSKMLIDGQQVETLRLHGYIQYSSTVSFNDNQVIAIILANEREEINSGQRLTARTHYKSEQVFVDNKVLIPSMLPEKKDIPNAPVWFGDGEEELKDYNYYRVWENASINIGLIFPKSRNYKIMLINKNGGVVAQDTFSVSKKPINIRFSKTNINKLSTHTLAEVDGGVFHIEGENMPNDEVVKKHSILELLIYKENNLFARIPLPYPFPYINRIFAAAKKE